MHAMLGYVYKGGENDMACKGIIRLPNWLCNIFLILCFIRFSNVIVRKKYVRKYNGIISETPQGYTLTQKDIEAIHYLVFCLSHIVWFHLDISLLLWKRIVRFVYEICSIGNVLDKGDTIMIYVVVLLFINQQKPTNLTNNRPMNHIMQTTR